MAVTSDPSDLSRLDFAKGAGLLPAVIQDADTGAVLMLGYMNAAALAATQALGPAVTRPWRTAAAVPASASTAPARALRF